MQTTGLLPAHVPLAQAYDWKQAFVPEHEVPSPAVGLEQVPLAGSQVPAAWHWSLAVHVTGLPPTHVPLWQLSLWVQALPSLHVVPLLASGLEQLPVAGLQAPAAWHWSLAVQTTGL